MSGCGKSQCCGGGGCGKQQQQQPATAAQSQEASTPKPTILPPADTLIASDSVEIKYGATDQMVAFKGCPSSQQSVGGESVCQSCPGKDTCSSQSANTDKRSIDIRMKVIKHKIFIMSGKGGVGKSSIASLLAYSLASRSKKVAILDVDICGPSIPKLMAVEGQSIVNSDAGWLPLKPTNGHDDNIRVMSIGSMLASQDASVVWRGPRKTNIINRFLKDTYWGRQDFLLVDTPPGTSDEHLSIVTALSSCKPDGAVIVTSPQNLSVDTVKREITFCKKMGVPILGIVENLSGYACPCCDEVTDIFSSDGGIKLAAQFNIPFLGKVPIDTNIGHCMENGKCLICDCPNSSGAKSIQSITDKLLDILSGGAGVSTATPSNNT
ncbi:hypothetical protein SAMD00019534_097370, partial [Acytostelium subglobosum LB1]|uniref:hypothetical protein n=1 Tax=Acytostelium subglobosum LB1 TaxID=1410327 RepID=UPI000644B1F9